MCGSLRHNTTFLILLLLFALFKSLGLIKEKKNIKKIVLHTENFLPKMELFIICQTLTTHIQYIHKKRTHTTHLNVIVHILYITRFVYLSYLYFHHHRSYIRFILATAANTTQEPCTNLNLY